MSQEIPLRSDASQTFEVELEGSIYFCRVIWNERLQYWTIGISDVDRNVLVDGVPLLIGVDVIEQYGLGIGGLFMVDSEGEGAEATFDNVGNRVKLIHLTEDELENGITI
jgi:hypothetical protein